MSKDIIVLAPNGRRQIIRCTPDTSILKILEDTCHKQGFQPSDYNLKHHNRILDLTTTIRFSNLPNKATVEMVEADRKREELNVTVGLLLEDGERRTADFPPNTALFDLVTSLAPSELSSIQNPSILYMRQEVTGLSALRDKTLRQLGLIKGRAILRLLNKAEQAKQANVSAVYRRPVSESLVPNSEVATASKPDALPGPSHRAFDPIALVKHAKNNTVTKNKDELGTSNDNNDSPESVNDKWSKIEADTERSRLANLEVVESSSQIALTEEHLERRLNIEEEVTFLGSQKAIAFMQPDEAQDELDDLPDEFYELSIEEVRRLYHDLQQQRVSLENTPLITSTKKEELEKQTSDQKLNVYKNAVVRIQFPDSMILQGVFQPTHTIQDINNFVKEHLKTPDKQFLIFTTPLKEALDPKTTLLEAKCVPCVHMHFKWTEEGIASYLREDIYTKKTSSDAANILASKYRAPSRRKLDESDNSLKSSGPSTSTSKKSKVPKWFK